MVHFFDSVSTNRFVTPLTQHATASSIVLYYYYCHYDYYYNYYYYYYISCICIYYVYRPTRSKPTTSCQKLYLDSATKGSDTKTPTSNYTTPMHRRHRSQSSVRLDDSSIISNHLAHRSRILPHAAALFAWGLAPSG